MADNPCRASHSFVDDPREGRLSGYLAPGTKPVVCDVCGFMASTYLEPQARPGPLAQRLASALAARQWGDTGCIECGVYDVHNRDCSLAALLAEAGVEVEYARALGATRG